MPVGGYAAFNRNMSAKRALENKATHLMFIDADMIFPPDGINKLLDHDKDIILANYNSRGVHEVVSQENNETRLILASTLKMGDKKDGNYDVIDFETLPKDRIFQVAGGGTGFMLIKTSVFEKLPYPWFVASEEGREWTTEDIFFCELARSKGIEIYCDPTIKMGHIGEYTY